jgi:AAA15 family ATPase/GTPase
MIIDFTVTNFRSIKDAQTFSLYAENVGTHLIENIAQPPAHGNINLLKSVGIYGANASGKSNLLRAFYALQYLIVKSGSLKDGDTIDCYEPFLLSDDTRSQPTIFEIEFLAPDGNRYVYKASFKRQKILKERLSFYQTSKESLVFERTESDTWETIKFGAFYKGGTKRFPYFSNNAYLSKAGNSADSPQMIRNVYNYFRNDIIHLDVNEQISYLDMVDQDDVFSKVSKLLSFVDTGVTKVSIHEKEVRDDDVKFPVDFPEQLKTKILREQKQQVLFSHKTDTGKIEYFKKSEESAGTRKLFDLAPLFIDAFDTGGVLIIDELDNSMHPFMAELIIKLFNDPDVNPGGAQLIYSTHNINLMSPELMRRDQIWFAEKVSGASRFYSLDDFDKKKVTPMSPYILWYAEGRFGAVPRIDYRNIVELLKKEVANAKAKK